MIGKKALLSMIFVIGGSIYKVNAQAVQNGVSDSVLVNGRRKIDSLDKKLLEVLGERERVVRGIGVYKAKNHIPSLQPARFQQVLQKGIEEGKKQGLSETFVTELLNAIHKESLRIEDELKQ